jgi:hypothetical protein
MQPISEIERRRFAVLGLSDDQIRALVAFDARIDATQEGWRGARGVERRHAGRGNQDLNAASGLPLGREPSRPVGLFHWYEKLRETL